MKQRCTNPRDSYWKDYGGRGIKVCERWLKFENFFMDMGPKPAGFQIDRRNNDGNYEPGNCQWVDTFKQQSHTRKTKLLTFDGRSMHLRAWARELGLSMGTIQRRLGNGWPIEKALSISPEVYKKRPKLWRVSSHGICRVGELRY